MLLRVALPLLAMVHANLESRSRRALGKEAVYQERAKLQDLLGQIPSIFMPCCFQLIGPVLLILYSLCHADLSKNP
jgi:hypothetical protein